MSRVRGFASWLVRGLFMAFLMSLYWFFRPPQNVLESFFAVIFCTVSAWLMVMVLGFLFRS